MVTLKMVATVTCDHEAGGRGCTEIETFERSAEEMSVDDFRRQSEEHFVQRGWRLFGGTRCPRHNS